VVKGGNYGWPFRKEIETWLGRSYPRAILLSGDWPAPPKSWARSGCELIINSPQELASAGTRNVLI
jgi:hypothetical protein